MMRINGQEREKTPERKEEYKLKPCYNLPPSVLVGVQAHVKETA